MKIPGILLDALLPPRCASCGRPGSRWCPACQAAAPQLAPPCCPRCSQPVAVAGQVCAVCHAHPPAFQRAAVWRAYGGTLQRAVTALKFRRDVGLAQLFGERLAEPVAAAGWPVEIVTPVPLGRNRLRERGYNQTALIARPLAALLGARYAPGALARARETRPQVGLSLAERRANVAGAFRGDPAHVSARCVLLVDDVMTTGATLDAASAAVLGAGASVVYAGAVARVI
ncbi:MAG: ComF family protein [Anaerolineae bacterium]|nr:MAG: ComF family protein [Anaerolineae bacterium]